MYCHLYNLFLFIFKLSILAKSQSNYEDEVDYYTELVQNGMDNSLTYQLPTSANEYRANPWRATHYGVYDFIIVGAGAAGSSLAGRLSSLTKFRILVLEAGTFGNNFTDIPNMYYYDRGTEYNWGFTSVPQTTCCLGMIDRKCPYARGKGFGGSTLLNALIYSRGNRKDFDRMANDGNRGWDYETMLKYFKYYENSSSLNGDDGYRGYKGPLNVQYHPVESYQTMKFIQANNELGIPSVDYNGAHQMGVSRIQSNIRDGKRLSSYRAFLEPFINRNNLHLLPNSYVTRIIVNETLNVRLVYFSHRNRLYVAKATKEIILSAGSINTPQILMLSGIGPANHLNDLRIPLVRNLSVGNNLQDHPTYYGIHFRTNYTDPIRSVRYYVKEYLNETGFFTVAANIQGIGYYESPINTEKGHPDMELIFVPAPILNNYTQLAFGFTDDTYRGLWGDVIQENSFIIYVVLLRPKSKGTIRLKSNDPYDYPLIDSQFLSDPDGIDIKKIYEGIKFIVNKLQYTKAFRSINATIGDINLPACQHCKRNSKCYWYCTIKHLTMNIYHPVGTSKMGPDPQNGAVVDDKLRVHGFKSLRIVDASVFPFSFSGHPAAPTMALGYRAYDFIVQDYL